jgi:hypothetical protein
MARPASVSAFEAAQPVGDGRLTDVHRLGRLGHAAGVHDSDQHRQVAGVDQIGSHYYSVIGAFENPYWTSCFIAATVDQADPQMGAKGAYERDFQSTLVR